MLERPTYPERHDLVVAVYDSVDEIVTIGSTERDYVTRDMAAYEATIDATQEVTQQITAERQMLADIDMKFLEDFMGRIIPAVRSRFVENKFLASRKIKRLFSSQETLLKLICFKLIVYGQGYLKPMYTAAMKTRVLADPYLIDRGLKHRLSFSVLKRYKMQVSNCFLALLDVKSITTTLVGL